MCLLFLVLIIVVQYKMGFLPSRYYSWTGSCSWVHALWAAYLNLARFRSTCKMLFTGSPTCSAYPIWSLLWFGDVLWLCLPLSCGAQLPVAEACSHWSLHSDVLWSRTVRAYLRTPGVLFWRHRNLERCKSVTTFLPFPLLCSSLALILYCLIMRALLSR